MESNKTVNNKPICDVDVKHRDFEDISYEFYSHIEYIECIMSQLEKHHDLLSAINQIITTGSDDILDTVRIKKMLTDDEMFEVEFDELKSEVIKWKKEAHCQLINKIQEIEFYNILP